MEPEGLLLHSQESAIGPYRHHMKPIPTLIHCIFKINFNIIMSYTNSF
jgi:hypothetical protein